MGLLSHGVSLPFPGMGLPSSGMGLPLLVWVSPPLAWVSPPLVWVSPPPGMGLPTTDVGVPFPGVSGRIQLCQRFDFRHLAPRTERTFLLFHVIRSMTICYGGPIQH
jgi:hypothetical protein